MDFSCCLRQLTGQVNVEGEEVKLDQARECGPTFRGWTHPSRSESQTSSLFYSYKALLCPSLSLSSLASPCIYGQLTGHKRSEKMISSVLEDRREAQDNQRKSKHPHDMNGTTIQRRLWVSGTVARIERRKREKYARYQLCCTTAVDPSHQRNTILHY